MPRRVLPQGLSYQSFIDLLPPHFFLVSDIVAYTSLEITTVLLPQPFQCWNFPTMSAFVPSASSWQRFQTWVMGVVTALKNRELLDKMF